MLPELFELGVHRALVFLDIRTGEVVLGGAVEVAFEFQIIVGDVPLGRYSTAGGWNDRGGRHGVIFQGVKEYPQESCRRLWLGGNSAVRGSPGRTGS